MINSSLKFIFDIINTRLKYLKYLVSQYGQQKIVENSKDMVKKWFTVPFIHSISHKFKHVIKDLDTRISYYSLNKLLSLRDIKTVSLMARK